MPPRSSHPLTHWWYTAQAEEIGIALRTDNIERLKAGLYKARSDASDESLKGLSIVVPPGTTDTLWIVKNGRTDAETEDR